MCVFGSGERDHWDHFGWIVRWDPLRWMHFIVETLEMISIQANEWMKWDKRRFAPFQRTTTKMTLLAIPFVLWGEAPTAAFTRATSSEDGRTLVLSLSNGALWLVRFQGLDVHGSLEVRRCQGSMWTVDLLGMEKACPVAYLVGHSAPVTAMLMCRLELDGPALNETVVVSGSETAYVVPLISYVISL